MQIREVMTSDVDLVDPDTPIREAARLMRDDDLGALPVGENDRLVGMITDRDIAVRGVAEGRDESATVGDVMSNEIFYCFADDDVEEAASKMATRQVRRLPVLNRDKRLVGIVALADISRSDEDTGGAALNEVSQPNEAAHA